MEITLSCLGIGASAFAFRLIWHQGGAETLPVSTAPLFKGPKHRSVQVPRYFVVPKTRTEWWTEKFRRNQERDARVRHGLEAIGWRVITIWECELKPTQREATLQRLLSLLRCIEAPVLVEELRKTSSYANSYSEDDLLMVAEDEEEYSSYNK